jgi:hypothetical protein
MPNSYRNCIKKIGKSQYSTETPKKSRGNYSPCSLGRSPLKMNFAACSALLAALTIILGSFSNAFNQDCI